MAVVVHFSEEAGKVIRHLSGNVVEVDSMTNGVNRCEEKSCESNDLVSSDIGIERNIVVEDGFSQVGDEVSGHGE